MSDVEITGNESLEELEAKLELLEQEPDGAVVDEPGNDELPVQQLKLQPDTANQTGDNAQPPADPIPDVPAATDPATADTPPPGGEADKATILAKDGKHTIPYEVLEATRERARQAEEQVQQLTASAAKVSQLEQQLQDLKQRAVDAGADESLLSDEGLTDEQLSDLSDEYPALGRHLRVLTQKINALNIPPEQTSGEARPGTNPVDIALTHTPDLDGWRNGDPDRWAMALVIDGQLQKDPTFSDKTMVQRFSEVQKRVKAAFGDTAPAKDEQAAITAQAEQKVAAAADVLPGSPSDIGSTVAHTPDKASQIAATDGNALLHAMDGMSDAEIDAMLSKLDY